MNTFANAAMVNSATTQALNRNPFAPTGVPTVRDQQWPVMVHPPTDCVTLFVENPAAIQLKRPVRI